MVLSIKVTKGSYSSNGCSQIRPRMAKWNLELGFMDAHGLHMGTFSSQLGSLGSLLGPWRALISKLKYWCCQNRAQ